MPREHRKRGKRKRKDISDALEHDGIVENLPNVAQGNQMEEDRPSWIETAPVEQNIAPEAPFGFCDPDLKGYFRTVNDQLREWQEQGIEKEHGDEEPGLGAPLLFS